MIAPVRERRADKARAGRRGSLDLTTYKRQFRILILDTLETIMMPPLLQRIVYDARGISIECPPQFRMDFARELLAGTLDLACYIYPLNAPMS